MQSVDQWLQRNSLSLFGSFSSLQQNNSLGLLQLSLIVVPLLEEDD